MTIPSPEAEPRLRARYHQLVLGHLSPTQILAAGLRAPPELSTPMAATQAAWRFYANKAVTLPVLAGPLIGSARAAVAAGACERHVLVALDWSALHYGGHATRADRVTLSNQHDLGYELLTALAIADRDGAPLAPLCLELRAADGTHSTRAAGPLRKDAPSLDTLGPVMAHVARSLDGGDGGSGVTPVFVIDREADSVGHYRAWDAAGHRFLVRADDRPRVIDERGVTRPLGEVADLLKRRPGAFTDAGEVPLEGRRARQFFAQTAVVLKRPARTHRVDPQTGLAVHRNVAGDPLPLRLIVSEVRDDATGKVLARWLLLSNVPPCDADAATVARWYYWRWRIESYHKLLKGAGQQVEHWQQETAAALARRLCVAAMACVVVWRLARDPRPQAAEFRDVLVRLSGRQMRRGKGARGFTEPALLAGLGVLVPMLALLEEYDLGEVRDLARQVLPDLNPTPPPRGRRRRG